MVGLIFRNARNKIRDPAKLRLLVVDLIGQTEWVGLSDDLKGDAYEGLLEKNARDTKSGAGQYFTPRGLIRALVECVNPQLGDVICDPACGTGGFLLAAYEHLRHQNPRMSAAEERHLCKEALSGVELVEEVARLAAMNFLLHGISDPDDQEPPIVCMDSLANIPRKQFDVVLTNPPFGVKGSVSYSRAAGRSRRQAEQLTVLRPDFWVETANKQLNFLQHVACLLKPGGRAAVVLPDNVLFEGGVGTAIRRRLLESFDVHTLLRLPRGLFYAQGVAANVLFFDRLARNFRASESLWVYDFRTDKRYSVKTKPLTYEDLTDFVSVYGGPRAGASANGRWQRFDRLDVLSTSDANLDLGWNQEAASSLAPVSRLDELAQEIADDLRQALMHVVRVSGGN